METGKLVNYMISSDFISFFVLCFLVFVFLVSYCYYFPFFFFFSFQANKDKLWTSRNYLSYRSLQMAENIQEQLINLLKTRLFINVELSCFPDFKEKLLKCLCLSFSMNIAQSIQSVDLQQNQIQKGKSSLSLDVVSNKNNKYFFNSTTASNSNNNNPTSILQSILMKTKDNNTTSAPYRTIKGNQYVHVHPSSVLFSMIGTKKLPSFVLYADLLITNKQYMRSITVIDGNWLSELFPDRFKTVE
jgi:hypothetical protein